MHDRIGVFRDRLFSIWKRTAALSWPIALQQTFETLMRTVDIIVTGFFSPAAVAAIGVADLYGQIPLRIGLGLGSGAIALSSQDTGRGAAATRDRAITQAFLIGALLGVPLVALGLTVSHRLIALLGAEATVVQLGGAYLAILFLAAPVRIVALVGARSLHGAGDTRTPMIATVVANVVNILTTLGLGLGLAGLPNLGIVGVGIGTAIGRTIEAGILTIAIAGGWTDLAFARPRDLLITRQLIGVSLPSFAEGMSSSIADFPFNALLLMLGTEVNAAYHIGRRVYQQLAGPLYRSANAVAGILVGQALGAGKPDEARFSGYAVTGLSLLALGVAGSVLVLGAHPIAGIFTSDRETLVLATTFTRVFGISMFFFGVFFPISGSLRSAGDTKTPFYARLSGTFIFKLGFAYLTAIVLGYGLVGIYAGIILGYVWWTLVATAGFVWGDWADTAAQMMAERADIPD